MSLANQTCISSWVHLLVTLSVLFMLLTVSFLFCKTKLMMLAF